MNEFGRQDVFLVETVTEKVARILSERYGVRVIFKADGCYTDGSNIYMPAIPINAAQEFLDAIPGLVDHEVSHMLHSDFQPFIDTRKEGKHRLNDIMQFLEDKRHEPLMVKKWRGSRSNFQRTNTWAKNRMLRDWEKLSPWGMFVQIMGSICHYGATDPFTLELAKRQPEMYTLAMTAEDLLNQAESQPDTASIRALGEQIMARIQQKVDQDEEEGSEGSEQQEGQGSEESQQKEEPQEEEAGSEEGPRGGNSQEEAGEEGSEEGGSGDETKEPDGLPEERCGEDDEARGGDDESEGDELDENTSDAGEEASDADPDAGDETSSTGEEAPKDDSGSKDNCQTENVPRDSGRHDQTDPVNESPESQQLKEVIREDEELSKEERQQNEQIADRNRMVEDEAQAAHEEVLAQPQSERPYLVYTTENDVIETIGGGDRHEMINLLEESRHITNAIRQKMMRNLLSTNNIRWEGNKVRGKIDRRALPRIIHGTSNRVFRKQESSVDFNTRIELIVDHSLSMRGRKLKLAAESALLFGEEIDKLNIPFEIIGWSTSTNGRTAKRIYDNASPEEQELYTRWGGLWIGIYKSFEEPWHAVKHRCVNMARNQKVNTFDGESIRWAAMRLLQFPEPRRILFVFNDGHPCPNLSFYAEHEEYLRQVIAEVEKRIEVFAIGIGDDSVKNFYSNCVTINSLNDLPKVMVGELDRLLRQKQNAYYRAV
jgi:hypothetical protein